MDSGFGDQDTDMQQRGSPNVDTKLVGKRIEVLGGYFDVDGKVLAVWGKGEFITIPVMKEKKQQQKIKRQKKKGRIIKKEKHWVIVMWEEEYMDEGTVNPTKQKLLKSM